MPSRFARTRISAIAALVVTASLALAAHSSAATPDVTQDNPLNDGVGGISLQQSGSAWHLVFPSDIYVSSGTLQISGQRADTSVFTMDAYQTDGGSAPVGALEYSIAYGHDHWHYLALDRYDLLPHNASVASDGLADTLGRDQKSGFCLEDSTGWNGYNQTQCQHNNPAALDLTGVNSEVIGAGRHDLYTPNVDGQYIDVTGVVAGLANSFSTQVELVQWVNADCRLGDTNTSDNTWSIVLIISKNASGQPSVSTGSTSTYWSQWYSNHPSQQCLPKDTVRPTVSGPTTTNNVESAAPGSWLIRMATGFSSPFLYQWRRCDATGWDCENASKGNGNIPGATSANYVPTTADLGHTLRVRVTGQFPGTTEQQTPEDSAATPVVVVGQPPSDNTTNSNSSSSNNQTGNNTTPTIVALTAALKADTHFSLRTLLKRGVRARAHCSEACSVRLNLLGPGAINLARGTGSIARAGSHTYTIHLTRRAKRTVSRYHGGTLMLWLHVKTKDGQQQTVSRVLHLVV
jgi:hypothetical protein